MVACRAVWWKWKNLLNWAHFPVDLPFSAFDAANEHAVRSLSCRHFLRACRDVKLHRIPQPAETKEFRQRNPCRRYLTCWWTKQTQQPYLLPVFPGRKASTCLRRTSNVQSERMLSTFKNLIWALVCNHFRVVSDLTKAKNFKLSTGADHSLPFTR